MGPAGCYGRVMDQKSLMPVLVAALVIFMLYRRVRRSFGRQPVHKGRMVFRAALLAVVGVALAILHPLASDGALAGGVVAGSFLGYVGLKHTQFETGEKGAFYTPHTYIGLFVTSLLIIRLIVRYYVLHRRSTPLEPAAGGDPWAAYQHNPLTIGIFGLVIGYYVFYNIGVLRRSDLLKHSGLLNRSSEP
jgi:Protein of unknown function (DUF1453)